MTRVIVLLSDMRTGHISVHMSASCAHTFCMDVLLHAYPGCPNRSAKALCCSLL